jgi:exopolyphosphatase / guanosine-5'-triphosphate,3'-diphosphate pyrophosphatase
VGSSGSAKALGEVCAANGFSEGAITLDGLKWLREQLISAGNTQNMDIAGLKVDRKPVIAAGLAIMLALFQELEIESMTIAQGAMREGILLDLLGRVHDQDMRDVTVAQFQRRYQVDVAQAERVEALALNLLPALFESVNEPMEQARHRLKWAARLYEVGISIAHSGMHKHGAYIVENADMPGFSRRDQVALAALVRASRGSLSKLSLSWVDANWPLILCLRLAVLFNYSRRKLQLTGISLSCHHGECELVVPTALLKANPLTHTALRGRVERLVSGDTCGQAGSGFVGFERFLRGVSVFRGDRIDAPCGFSGSTVSINTLANQTRDRVRHACDNCHLAAFPRSVWCLSDTV